jgi:hypothetical protein
MHFQFKFRLNEKIISIKKLVEYSKTTRNVPNLNMKYLRMILKWRKVEG